MKGKHVISALAAANFAPAKATIWEFLLPEVCEGEELPRWLIYSPIITLQILIKASWSEIYNTATLTLGFQNNQGVFSGVFS